MLDLGHDSRHVLGRGCGSASQLAFSLGGRHLAATTVEGIAPQALTEGQEAALAA